MYNKNQYKATNCKKVMHKIKKQWVTISLSLLLMISGGALASHLSASANTVQQSKPEAMLIGNNTGKRTITNQAKLAHQKLLSNATKRIIKHPHRPINTTNSGDVTTINNSPAKDINNVNFLRNHQSGIYKGNVYNRINTPFPKLRASHKVALHSTITLKHDHIYGYIYTNHTVKIAKAFKEFGHYNNYLRYEIHLNKKRNAFISGNGLSPVLPMRNYKYYQKELNTLLHKVSFKNSHKIRKEIRSLNQKQSHNYKTYAKLYEVAFNDKQSSKFPVIVDYNSNYGLKSDNSTPNSLSNTNNISVTNNNNVQTPQSLSDNTESKDINSNANTIGISSLASNASSPGVSPSSSQSTSMPITPNVSDTQSSFVTPMPTNTSSDNAPVSKSSDSANEQSSSTNQPVKSNFTSDEINKINGVKNQYDYLEQNEDQNNISNSTLFRNEIIDWVNFYRSLYNLEPVTENASFDQIAQSGADNNSDPEDWSNEEIDGQVGKPNSDYVQNYFTDDHDIDSDNETEHRDSILDPKANQIGVGQDGYINTLYFNWGLNNGNQNNLPTSITYPNASVFPLSYAKDGEYWTYQFKTHPYGTSDTTAPEPTITVHDDTNNTNVNVNSIHQTAQEIYYKVDTNALDANHQYTISISGPGIPNGNFTYTTKLFNLD